MSRVLDRSRLEGLLRQEEARFHAEHPRSFALYQRACQSMQGGVPRLWMIRWVGTFPIQEHSAWRWKRRLVEFVIPGEDPGIFGTGENHGI